MKTYRFRAMSKTAVIVKIFLTCVIFCGIFSADFVFGLIVMFKSFILVAVKLAQVNCITIVIRVQTLLFVLNFEAVKRYESQ